MDCSSVDVCDKKGKMGYGNSLVELVIYCVVNHLASLHYCNIVNVYLAYTVNAIFITPDFV